MAYINYWICFLVILIKLRLQVSFVQKMQQYANLFIALFHPAEICF